MYNGYFILSREDSPYIDSYLNLSTTATATKVLNCQPLDNGQFFQWLMKKSRMVMKFDTYGTLLINRCNRTFRFCFIYTVAVN